MIVDEANRSFKIGVLNTSVASENTGDFIIMEAALEQIESCLPMAQKWHLTTHESLSWASFKIEKDLEFNVACGTNLLHSHMMLVKQWNIGLFASWFMKPVMLLGVGWRSASKRSTTIYTKALLKRLLDRDRLHSVRDSYTARRLKEIGFDNVINTACPTMWKLTPEHCESIPDEKGEDVVVTLTDYSQDRVQDGRLLQVLADCYRRVYFWCQGSGDYAYARSIANEVELEILAPDLNAFDRLLGNSSVSLDYVGTRLHGGIRALQHKRRSLIIGVDHRAIEKGRDFHLPVLDRYISEKETREAIESPLPCEIKIPLEGIQQWKAQFGA